MADETLGHKTSRITYDVLVKQTWFVWFRRLYVLSLLIFVIAYKTFWAPDILFLMGLSVFALYGLGKDFVKKFLPFVLLLVAYESLRGFAPYVTKHVHYRAMIDFDTWLGRGTIPTVRLQHLLYQGYLTWYDYYFYTLYMMHFFVPFIFAVWIWRTRLAEYWRYVISLIVLSFSAFVTYIAFPAAPPWMASNQGLIPTIEKLSHDIWWGWGVHNFPTIYHDLNPNTVAAVPSLHSAYPMLTVLFIFRLYGWKFGVPAMLYPISVWVGVVYMGEHYVFDVLLGILYALVAYFVTNYSFDRFEGRKIAKMTPVELLEPVMPKKA